MFLLLPTIPTLSRKYRLQTRLTVHLDKSSSSTTHTVRGDCSLPLQPSTLPVRREPVTPIVPSQ